MTAPTATSTTAVLDVVAFTQRDPLFGTSFPAVGVVVVAGDVLTVRPLASNTVQLDPADVTVLGTGADEATGTGTGAGAADGDGPG